MTLNGPDETPRSAGMRQALAAARLEPRKPTEEDAPKPSTFPLTKAAKEAVRLERAERKRKRSR